MIGEDDQEEFLRKDDELTVSGPMVPALEFVIAQKIMTGLSSSIDTDHQRS